MNSKKVMYEIPGVQELFPHCWVQKSPVVAKIAKPVMPYAIGVISREDALKAPSSLFDLFSIKKIVMTDFLLQEEDGGTDYRSVLDNKHLHLPSHLTDETLELELFYDKDVIKAIAEKMESQKKKAPQPESEDKASSETGEYTTLFERDYHFFDPKTNTNGFIAEGTILPKIITQGWALYLDGDSLNDFLNSRP